MANVFDIFDTEVEEPQEKKAKNIFDQFDAAKPKNIFDQFDTVPAAVTKVEPIVLPEKPEERKRAGLGVPSYVEPGKEIYERAPSLEEPEKKVGVFQMPEVEVTAPRREARLTPEEQARVSPMQLEQYRREAPPSITEPTTESELAYESYRQELEKSLGRKLPEAKNLAEAEKVLAQMGSRDRWLLAAPLYSEVAKRAPFIGGIFAGIEESAKAAAEPDVLSKALRFVKGTGEAALGVVIAHAAASPLIQGFELSAQTQMDIGEPVREVGKTVGEKSAEALGFSSRAKELSGELGGMITELGTWILLAKAPSLFGRIKSGKATPQEMKQAVEEIRKTNAEEIRQIKDEKLRKKVEEVAQQMEEVTRIGIRTEEQRAREGIIPRPAEEKIPQIAAEIQPPRIETPVTEPQVQKKQLTEEAIETGQTFNLDQARARWEERKGIEKQAIERGEPKSREQADALMKLGLESQRAREEVEGFIAEQRRILKSKMTGKEEPLEHKAYTRGQIEEKLNEIAKWQRVKQYPGRLPPEQELARPEPLPPEKPVSPIGEQQPLIPQGMTRLYRSEPKEFDTYAQQFGREEGTLGRWFSADLEKARSFSPEGSTIKYVDIPTADLTRYVRGRKEIPEYVLPDELARQAIEFSPIAEQAKPPMKMAEDFLASEYGETKIGDAHNATWIGRDGRLLGNLADHQESASKTLDKFGMKYRDEYDAPNILQEKTGIVKLGIQEENAVVTIFGAPTDSQLGKIKELSNKYNLSWARFTKDGKPIDEGKSFDDLAEKYGKKPEVPEEKGVAGILGRPEKFRQLADQMQGQIDERRREMTQNPTPKRMKEYRSRVIEGDDLERAQQALRTLADAHERGTVPPILRELKSKSEVLPLVRKGTTGGGGYYDVIASMEYKDTSPQGKALQDLMEAKPELRVADVEKQKAQKLAQMEAEVQFRPLPGFFPTPKPLVRKMIEAADIEEGQKILEPSAGKGDILDVLKEEKPEATDVKAVELMSPLVNILEAKGYDVTSKDFLEYKEPADKILMNPPFEKGQDIDHVRHAYDLLNPGGRLVAIMSEGSFSRSDKKATGFREWLDEVDGRSEKIERGAFTGKETFRQTGVASRMVVIDKPAEAKPQIVAAREEPIVGAMPPGLKPAEEISTLQPMKPRTGPGKQPTKITPQPEGRIENYLNPPGWIIPVAGQLPVKFIPRDGINLRVTIGKRGAIVVEGYSPSGYMSQRDPSIIEALQEALNKEFGVPREENVFYRYTNNAKELEVARTGKLRPSFHQVDQVSEMGVSVATDPSYGVLGHYKYAYKLTGDVIGTGFDGEPVLDPKTIKPLQDKLSSAEKVSDAYTKARKKTIEAALRRLDWTREQYKAARKNFTNVIVDGQTSNFKKISIEYADRPEELTRSPEPSRVPEGGAQVVPALKPTEVPPEKPEPLTKAKLEEAAPKAALTRAEEISTLQPMKSRTGPGKQPTEIKTPQPEGRKFKNWFADSKIVDKSGNPLVVYHGTGADVKSFDPRFQGLGTQSELAQKGIFFTNSKAAAQTYADRAPSREFLESLPGSKKVSEVQYALQDQMSKELSDYHDSFLKTHKITEDQLSENEVLYKKYSEAYDKIGQKYETQIHALQDDFFKLHPKREAVAVPRIVSAHLRIRQPEIIDARGAVITDIEIESIVDKALRDKRDGVVIRNVIDVFGEESLVSDVYIAFSPEQVRIISPNLSRAPEGGAQVVPALKPTEVPPEKPEPLTQEKIQEAAEAAPKAGQEPSRLKVREGIPPEELPRPGEVREERPPETPTEVKPKEVRPTGTEGKKLAMELLPSAAYLSVDALPVDDDTKEKLKIAFGALAIAGLGLAASNRIKNISKDLRNASLARVMRQQIKPSELSKDIQQRVRDFLHSEEAKSLTPDERKQLALSHNVKEFFSEVGTVAKRLEEVEKKVAPPLGEYKSLKQRNDAMVGEIVQKAQEKAAERAPRKPSKTIISTLKDKLNEYRMEALNEGLAGDDVVEHVRARLIDELSSAEEFGKIKDTQKAKAFARLQTDTVAKWLGRLQVQQKRWEIAQRVAARRYKISENLADRIITTDLPVEAQMKLLETSKQFRTTPGTQGRFTARFKSRVASMADTYGAAGGELTNRMYQGDISRSGYTEEGFDFVRRIRDVYDKIKNPFETQELSNGVIDGLQDRTKAEKFLDTEAKKEVYNLSRQMLDYFRAELKAKGYKTREDYFSHIKDVDILEQVLDDIVDAKQANPASLNSWITEKSQFLKPREFADIEMRRDLPSVLATYVKSVSKELAYKDAVEYYYTEFPKDIPVALRRNSMDRAMKLMRASLNPERGQGLFYRAVNFIRSQQYRNFLGMNFKASVQNFTQVDFARWGWLKEADRLRRELWLKHQEITGPLADAISIASTETPRFLELIKEGETLQTGTISDTFNKIDTFQMSERRNWSQTELGSILNSVMKNPRYAETKARFEGDQIKTVNELLKNKEVFDKAVREAATTAAVTQVSPAPSMRGEFYDDLTHRIIGMFTAFKTRQLQVLGQTLGRQEGVNGARAKAILRRGLSGDVAPVEVLREVETTRRAMDKMLTEAKKYKQNLGVSHNDIQKYVDWLKVQEADLNMIVKKIEPLGETKARTVGLMMKYWAKVAAISIGFSLLWDSIDIAVFGQEDNDKNVIAKALKNAFWDVLPSPFYGLNPGRFLVSPVAPQLERTFPYGRFSPRGFAQDITSYGLSAIPFAGVIDRATGRKISKAIVDIVAPKKKKVGTAPPIMGKRNAIEQLSGLVK